MRSYRPQGLTLLEVLIALVILAVIAGILAQLRVGAVRHAMGQREHATASHLLRSELEALRAGGRSEGPCGSLGADTAVEGYACEVLETCTFPASMCAGPGGGRAFVVRVVTPSGATAEVPILVRPDSTRGVVAQR